MDLDLYDDNDIPAPAPAPPPPKPLDQGTDLDLNQEFDHNQYVAVPTTCTSCSKGCCASKKKEDYAAQSDCGTNSFACVACDPASTCCKSGCCSKDKSPPLQTGNPQFPKKTQSSSSCAGCAGCANKSAIELETMVDPTNLNHSGLEEADDDDMTLFLSNNRSKKTSPLLNLIRKMRADGNESHSVGITIADSATTVTTSFKVSGMSCCASCAATVERHFNKKRGVLEIKTYFLTEKVVVKHDTALIKDVDIAADIVALGFKAELLPPNSTSCALLDICVPSDKKQIRTILKAVENFDGVESVVQVHTAANNQSPTTTTSSTITVSVQFDPDITGPRTIIECLEQQLGLAASLAAQRSNNNNNGKPTTHMGVELHKWKRSFWLCLAFSLPVLMLSILVPLVAPPIDALLAKEIIHGLSVKVALLLLLTTPVQFAISSGLYVSAYKALRVSKQANMDLLIIISTLSAYVYSLASLGFSMFKTNYQGDYYFETSAYLMTLVMLGRYLEVRAISSTSSALTKLMSLQANTANLIVGGSTENGSATASTAASAATAAVETRTIDIALVQRNDLLRILPGERVPTDGVIVFGSTTVDESMVTGESMPVAKGVGSNVIGATINQNGTIHIRVTRAANEATLSEIYRMVEEAQVSKAPTQRLADRVSSYFVPVIIVLAVATFIFWYALAANNVLPEKLKSPSLGSVPFALMFAMTVLVISCPCAISLSAPTAVMVATGVGAKLGILFKGGPVLESAHRVRTVVFDKTGTLTVGQPKVIAYEIFSSTFKKREFFQFVASAESASEHVIGKAISKYAVEVEKCVQVVEPEDFESIPGRGLKCNVLGCPVLIGNLAWMHENGITTTSNGSSNNNNKKKKPFPEDVIRAHESAGHTTICVSIDGELAGIIVLSDTAKPEARAVIAQLDQMGIEVWMLSGDNNETCLSVAQSVGIRKDRVVGQLLPGDKAARLKKMQQAAASSPAAVAAAATVAMVGDGINDSVALVQADVGIALGAGTDIAMEAADIVLMKSDLRDVLVALDLSRKCFSRIRINFAWAFLYNLLGIPIAAGALFPFLGIAVPPSIAGFSEVFSSIPVIISSLLLKRYKPPLQQAAAATATATAAT